MESGTRNGGLKQRLARMFRAPTFLRSACKPSTSSAARAANSNSSAASTRALLEDAVLEPVFVPRRPSLSVIGDDVVDCGGCRPNKPLAPRSMKWGESKGPKKERRVRETGGYYETGEWEGRTCPPASPSSPSKSCYYYHCLLKEDKKKKKKKKKQVEMWIKIGQKQRLRSNSYGFSSSSSAESDDGEGNEFFSSDERELRKGEETETFFSSRSFSSDSSEFYQRPSHKKKKKKKTEEEKKTKTKSKRAKKTECPQRRRGKKREGWGGCKGFHPLVTVGAAAGGNKERKRGFAVVKRSSDPYSDFRGSMVEMIVERQIFGAEDLEGLLDSYLSLNARHLHPLILQAFSDIWVVLFGH